MLLISHTLPNAMGSVSLAVARGTKVNGASQNGQWNGSGNLIEIENKIRVAEEHALNKKYRLILHISKPQFK